MLTYCGKHAVTVRERERAMTFDNKVLTTGRNPWMFGMVLFHHNSGTSDLIASF